MGFSFYQTSTSFEILNKKIDQRHLFTIGSKKERRIFSKFIKSIQFTVPNINIELTSFPQMKDYHEYNSCPTDGTLRSEVTNLVSVLNMRGYFLVAEVSLTS